MPSDYAQSQYDRGYKNVGFSLYALIAGIICLFFYFLIGISLIVIGIILFVVGTKQKRLLKYEMREDSLEDIRKEPVMAHKLINKTLDNISLGESIDYFNNNNEWSEVTDEGSKELFAPSPKGEILFEKSGAKYIVAACVLEKCYKIALQTSHPDGQEKIKLFSKQYGSPIKEESWWNIWDDGETTLEIMTRMPVVNIILTDKELFQKGFNQ